MSRSTTLLLAALHTSAACSPSDSSGPVPERHAARDSVPPQSQPGQTGIVGGTVVTEDSTQTVYVPGASVWLYAGDPMKARDTWRLVATTRSDTLGGFFPGYFRIENVPAGPYFLRADQPENPSLAPGLTQIFHVTNDVVSPSIFLPTVAARGQPYVTIIPRSQQVIAVCSRVFYRVAVGDHAGEPMANPAVRWTSSDPAIVIIGAEVVSGQWLKTVVVRAVGPGLATITADVAGRRDSVRLEVVSNGISCPDAGPVATVTITPDGASFAAPDTVGFSAVLRDAAGTVIGNRSVSWFTSDSTVFVIEGSGMRITARGRNAGHAILRATVDGKSDSAAITVY